MSERHSADNGRDEPERVVVRDRRRIDPLTGEVRTPGAADNAASGPEPAASPAEPPTPDPTDEKLAELTAQLDERTADLQRVTAEYANYRRRADRDREAVALAARAQVANGLLTVLDDVDRARAHGDLTGPFKAVADKLVNALTAVGLEAFGAEGDPFDPAVHEAVQHSTSPDVTGPTVAVVMRRGYKIGDRVLRPVMVGVTDREPGAPDLPADRGAGEQAGADEQAGATDTPEDTKPPGNGDGPSS